jgi:hypothetical protein
MEQFKNELSSITLFLNSVLDVEIYVLRENEAQPTRVSSTLLTSLHPSSPSISSSTANFLLWKWYIFSHKATPSSIEKRKKLGEFIHQPNFKESLMLHKELDSAYELAILTI